MRPKSSGVRADLKQTFYEIVVFDVGREPSEDGAAEVGGGGLLAHELDGVRARLSGEATQQRLQHVVAEGRLEQLVRGRGRGKS